MCPFLPDTRCSGFKAGLDHRTLQDNREAPSHHTAQLSQRECQRSGGVEKPIVISSSEAYPLNTAVLVVRWIFVVRWILVVSKLSQECGRKLCHVVPSGNGKWQDLKREVNREIEIQELCSLARKISCKTRILSDARNCIM